jgi:pSer/pThr/pTyr-binding forkhead associated (FHA) protein
MNEPALELFRNACGLTTPFALEFDEAGGPTADSAVRQFDNPFVLIGRDPRSDLVLENAQISRRHMFLQVIAGRIFVVDLHSRTKVYWEGEESPRSQGWLDPARFIQVGPYRIRSAGDSPRQDGIAEQPPDPTASMVPERRGAGLVPRASLELPIRMGGGPSLWALDEQLVLVGRSEECQFVLNDESVSRFHAALVPTPSGVWVVDLLARDGVQVNGERVRWAWLADGDSFRVGSFTFILRYEAPPDRITRRDVPLLAGASVVGQAGTQLAVRAALPDNNRRGLTVLPANRSPAPLKVTSFDETVEPAQLVPSTESRWDPSIPFSPNPIAMWQQQMQLMESFHNDMILMVQMFAAMHREHLASVRHELDMVQRLTQELGVLQGRVTESPRSNNAGRDRLSHKQGADRTMDRKKKSSKPLPADAVELTRNERNATEPAKGTRAAGAKLASGNGPDLSESVETPAGGSEQIHAGLAQRIAALQRERQGYWQRILSNINK